MNFTTSGYSKYSATNLNDILAMQTSVGRVTEMVLFCEFCEMDMFAESENGVPAQFFE